MYGSNHTPPLDANRRPCISTVFFLSDYTRYVDKKRVPFLYMVRNRSVIPEAKVQVLMVKVDEEKISTKRPIVQQSIGFVVGRSQFKKKEALLVTDIGPFRNIGISLKILMVKIGEAEVVRTVTGPEKKSSKVKQQETKRLPLHHITYYKS